MTAYRTHILHKSARQILDTAVVEQLAPRYWEVLVDVPMIGKQIVYPDQHDNLVLYPLNIGLFSDEHTRKRLISLRNCCRYQSCD